MELLGVDVIDKELILGKINSGLGWRWLITSWYSWKLGPRPIRRTVSGHVTSWSNATYDPRLRLGVWWRHSDGWRHSDLNLGINFYSLRSVIFLIFPVYQNTGYLYNATLIFGRRHCCLAAETLDKYGRDLRYLTYIFHYQNFPRNEKLMNGALVTTTPGQTPDPKWPRF